MTEPNIFGGLFGAPAPHEISGWTEYALVLDIVDRAFKSAQAASKLAAQEVNRDGSYGSVSAFVEGSPAASQIDEGLHFAYWMNARAHALGVVAIHSFLADSPALADKAPVEEKPAFEPFAGLEVSTMTTEFGYVHIIDEEYSVTLCGLPVDQDTPCDEHEAEAECLSCAAANARPPFVPFTNVNGITRPVPFTTIVVDQGGAAHIFDPQDKASLLCGSVSEAPAVSVKPRTNCFYCSQGQAEIDKALDAEA